MDKHPDREKQLLDAALQKAAGLGLRLETVNLPARQRDAGIDAMVQLRAPAKRIRFGVEIKHHLRPGTLGPLIQRLQTRDLRPLLVTDEITPALAVALRAQGIEFLDTAGNAYFNQPGLLVFVKGEKGGVRAPKDEPTRAFKPAGLQVIFALLATKGFETRPYREIGKAAGVATGVVGNVMAELPKLGFLVELKGTRRLVERDRLIDRWAEAYVRTLRPKLLLGRFAADPDDVFRRVFANGETCVAGGEAAAAHLTQHLRAVTATLYAETLDAPLIARFRLRQDPQGKIDVRRRFWRFDGKRPGLAPALLIYADLLAIGDDRCLETAKILRERFVD